MGKSPIRQSSKNYSDKIKTTPMTADQKREYEKAVKAYQDSSKAWANSTDDVKNPEPKVPDYQSFKLKNSPAKQTGETVNTAGQVIPTGIGDAAPNNAFNASVTPPQPNRAGAPPRNIANLNTGIGVDPNTSNFKNNQASNNAALAGGGNVPGMQVPQTMAAKYGSIAKMNAGFVKLPKEVQNKILNNEK